MIFLINLFNIQNDKKPIDKLSNMIYNRYIESKEDKIMKKFVYQVNEFEWVDIEAFGVAWEQAKAKATQLHTPIFRKVVKGDKVKLQVYYKGGVFNSVEFMRDDNVKVW